MTNREKADAYFMYLEGSSFQEIADHYGVTKQYIHTMSQGSKGTRLDKRQLSHLCLSQ